MFTICLLYPPLAAYRNTIAETCDATVQVVPYLESPALRSARARGRTIAALADTAPRLTDEQWALLARCDAVVALDVPAQLNERAPRLQWVQLIGAGTDHVDLNAFAEKGVVVTNASGIAARTVAEFVFARLLQVWKELRTLDAQQVSAEWRPRHGDRVSGKTLGLVGLGAIGRQTARLGRAFGMTVFATRRSARSGDVDPDVDRLFPSDELEAMLPRCDAVVVAAPATPETAGLLDGRRIALMRPGSVLCNVARGSLVDEFALVAALGSGHLRAAIVDVAAVEPAPTDSPLWTASNSYFSPHCAVALDGYVDELAGLVIRNACRLISNEALTNRVI